MKSDIEIAQLSKPLNITQIAESADINPEYLEQYGKYKAKINNKIFTELKDKKDAKLVLVTAINPTPAGEGKTTTTIGLSQALNKLGTKSIVALREPSLGPCMGVKGGATGGGYSQVVPMEEINLHFTGDLHAISTAHNLLSTMIDNHIQQGNELNIDVRNVVWTRVMDMNDRALRNIIVGLGGKSNGVPREDGFIITVASEVMAILCLSEDLENLKERLGKIIVAYNTEGSPVTCKDIGANGAMTVLLKDAIKPNLVQTLENTPALLHGGPFANIAHGCNSIIATKLALKLADVVVTEAGFGSDLGAEKFFDIKCRKANLKPDAAVLVATIRALKYNGKVSKQDLPIENVEAVKKGSVNLQRHIENIKKYGVPVVVTLNQFTTDTEAEINVVRDMCAELGVLFELSQVWEKGGEGGIGLAKVVLEALQQPSNFKCLYDENLSVKEKLATISSEIYRAKGVVYSSKALKDIEKINRLGFDKLPICIAKTQYSFSSDASLLGAPENFDLSVNEIKISAGAGFLVAITGDIMTMPGLPKKPAALNIDINAEGDIVGLF